MGDGPYDVEFQETPDEAWSLFEEQIERFRSEARRVLLPQSILMPPRVHALLQSGEDT